MYTELYSSTHPVKDSKMFYGYKEDIEDILKRLQRECGDSFSITGGRRMGKTSFLLELDRKLRDKETVIPVYFTLQEWSSNLTYLFIYQRIIEEVVKAKNLSAQVSVLLEKEWSQEKAFEKFQERLCEIVQKTYSNLKIVILLDEAEYLVDKEWTIPFCDKLRVLLTSSSLNRNIVLVMAGSGAILPITGKGSPLRNILANKQLKLFSESESKALINEPTEERLSKEIVDAILVQTGGHPFLIQYIMENLCRNPRLEEVTLKELNLTLKKFLEERNDFEKWFDTFDDIARLSYSIIIKKDNPVTRGELIKEIGDWRKVSDALSVLSHTGVIREISFHTYVPGGEMFKNWFKDWIAQPKIVQPSREITEREYSSEIFYGIMLKLGIMLAGLFILLSIFSSVLSMEGKTIYGFLIGSGIFAISAGILWVWRKFK